MTTRVGRWTGRAALAMALAGVAAGTGCDSRSALGPRENQIASFGGSATTSSLSGTWQRTLFFLDEFGFSNATETTWQFRADGAASRTVITSNLTLGTSDVVITTARWRVSGTRVIIDFVSPTTGTIELEFTIQGNQLVLAGESFTRVGG